MVEIVGLEGIVARIIADSITPTGQRLTTYELEYPRLIHSELMTHKMLVKNAASSRAIPVKKMIELIKSKPAMPVHWGKNQSGMAAREEVGPIRKKLAQAVWLSTMHCAALATRLLDAIGIHKQIANRPLEFAQRIKTVLTGTEFANFFHLRDHADAQPEFHELARVMRIARELSVPTLLSPGQWHLPYVDVHHDTTGDIHYTVDGTELTTDQALKVSASCCAQTSYRKLDDTLEAANRIYSRLVESDPAHMSPTEHQGMVMQLAVNDPTQQWEDGVTHVRRDGSLWSANFRGWVQARQLIKNEAVWQ